MGGASSTPDPVRAPRKDTLHVFPVRGIFFVDDELYAFIVRAANEFERPTRKRRDDKQIEHVIREVLQETYTPEIVARELDVLRDINRTLPGKQIQLRSAQDMADLRSNALFSRAGGTDLAKEQADALLYQQTRYLRMRPELKELVAKRLNSLYGMHADLSKI